MKWILVPSLILNVVLTYQVLQKKEVVRKEIVEKVVVKKTEPMIVEKKVVVEATGKTKEAPPIGLALDDVEIEDQVTDVNRLREDFLVGKLQFSEKDFKAIEVIKQRYSERFQKAYDPDGFLTIAKRRELLNLEEERDREYARAVGPQKWKEWETFRDNFNRKLFKRSMKEQSGVVVPMEI